MNLKPLSFHVLERGNENRLIWTYPSINDQLKFTILKTCFSTSLEAVNLFYYQHVENYWIYIYQFVENGTKLAIIIISQYYHPKLYRTLCDMFFQKYTATKSGADLVQLFLKIYVKNGISLKENSSADFIQLKDFPQHSNLKGLTKNLGIEIILLCHALILKKNILVYHPDVEILQKALETIMKLLSYKEANNILQPLIRKDSDLRTKSVHFLKGTTRNNLLSLQNLFDLRINLQKCTVEISPKSNEFFHMSSLHKEVAHSIIKIAESDASELEIIEQYKKLVQGQNQNSNLSKHSHGN